MDTMNHTTEPARYPRRHPEGVAGFARRVAAARRAHALDRAQAEAAIAALPADHAPREARAVVSAATGHRVGYTPHEGRRQRDRADRRAEDAVARAVQRAAHASAYRDQVALIAELGPGLEAQPREAWPAALAPHVETIQTLVDRGGPRHPIFARWVAALVRSGAVRAACAWAGILLHALTASAAPIVVDFTDAPAYNLELSSAVDGCARLER